MRILDLRHRLRTLGANPAHEQHVLRRWAQAKPQDSGRRRIDNYLPQTLRDALPALTDELAALARLHSEHPAADGSARLLIALHDGQTVEAVRLPRSEGLCVSSQVGCAVGCVFCMTGKSGLLRQLGSAEIVAQVALARQQRAVNKVVFMGMGEPAHNLDNVMEAIELLGQEGGIGHKNLVFSTVGDARVFDRLMGLSSDEVKPALALSLHTTSDARREQLLAARTAHHGRRTGRARRTLRPRHRLPDPVPVDAAGRHQRRRRRDRGHRVTAAAASTRS